MANQRSIIYEPKDPEDLARFLKINKEKYHEIWVVLVKKTRVDPQPVSFNEAVTMAVELGLVDNRTKSLDNERYMVRFTKRKSKKI